MARISQDREDLLLEATALVPRVMLRVAIDHVSCEVFAGYRGDSVSVYFGSNPVYHFNAVGELRRAFIDDCLFKAECGQLVGMVRERSAKQVVLASEPLPAEGATRFTADLADRLAELRDNLNRGAFELIGQVPPDGDVVGKLQAWLASWPGPIIADVAYVT